MSEILSKNPEQAPSDGAGKTEYPPFNKQAAEEARAQKMAELKAEHPDLVEDPEKARAMAEAENPHRKNMQDIRNYSIEKENPSYAEELPESQRDTFQLSTWKGKNITVDAGFHRPAFSDGSSAEEFALQYEEAKANQAALEAATEYDAHEQEMERIRQNADATRVEDIEKARVMAEAEDRDREKVTDVQNAIKRRRDPGYQYRNISDEQKRAEFEASATRGQTDIFYQEEFLKNTNQPHDFKSAAKSTLEMHKRAAEKAGEEAGEQYDRSH